MKPIFKDDHWKVTVRWSRPVSLKRVSEHGDLDGDDVMFYMITAKSAGGGHKGVYIGQAYSQRVRKRVGQLDHLRKQNEWQQCWPRHKLMISFGTMSLSANRKIVLERVNDVESILIYCFDNDYCRNKKAMKRPTIKGNYLVVNSGFRVDELPRKLFYWFACSSHT